MSNCCNANFSDISLRTLSQAGLRITKQRIAVINCLAEAEEPLSAPEIFEIISQNSESTGSLDRVSVYRAVETLLKLNLIHRVFPTGAYLACTHQNCTDTHHVMSRCTSCSQVAELGVPSEVIAPLLYHLKNSFEFAPDSHLLHVDGLCPDCSKSV